MKVEQFYNKNQFVIMSADQIVFQSYNSTIAIIKDSKLTLGHNWDYSKTTMKHLYLFLDEYCSSIKDFNDDYISYMLEKCSNKRAYLQKCIDMGFINYNPTLY